MKRESYKLTIVQCTKPDRKKWLLYNASAKLWPSLASQQLTLKGQLSLTWMQHQVNCPKKIWYSILLFPLLSLSNSWSHQLLHSFPQTHTYWFESLILWVSSQLSQIQKHITRLFKEASQMNKHLEAVKSRLYLRNASENLTLSPVKFESKLLTCPCLLHQHLL